MGSILADMESHFEPMSCEYCIEKGWTHIGLDTYEKVVTVRMPFRYYPNWDDPNNAKLHMFDVKFRCRYYDSFYDEFKYFTIRFTDDWYRTLNTSAAIRANFKNSITDITFDIKNPSCVEVEAATMPEFLAARLKEQMVIFK